MSVPEKFSCLDIPYTKGGIRMRSRDDILQRAAMRLDLSGEPVPGMPLVEIYGRCRVLIENHHGIKYYTCCEISVCTKLGEFNISGKNLEIASMTKQRLVITGEIDCVSMIDGR